MSFELTGQSKLYGSSNALAFSFVHDFIVFYAPNQMEKNVEIKALKTRN